MTDEAKKIVDALRTTDEQCFAYKNCEDCIMYEYCFTEQDKSIEKDAANLIEQLSEELEQVKRERDAAVYDIEHYADCDACKKAYEEEGCKKPCRLVWRGVVKENED